MTLEYARHCRWMHVDPLDRTAARTLALLAKVIAPRVGPMNARDMVLVNMRALTIVPPLYHTELRPNPKVLAFACKLGTAARRFAAACYEGSAIAGNASFSNWHTDIAFCLPVKQVARCEVQKQMPRHEKMARTLIAALGFIMWFVLGEKLTVSA